MSEGPFCQIRAQLYWFLIIAVSLTWLKTNKLKSGKLCIPFLHVHFKEIQAV